MSPIYPAPRRALPPRTEFTEPALLRAIATSCVLALSQNTGTPAPAMTDTRFPYARTVACLAVAASLLAACANGGTGEDELEGGDPRVDRVDAGTRADGSRADGAAVGTDAGRADAAVITDSAARDGSSPRPDSAVSTPDANPGVCTPLYSTSNQACSDCSRSQCCASMNGFFGNAQQPAFAACINACGATTACIASCTTNYPTAGAQFQSYYGCTQLSCQTACGTPGGGGGGTCTPTQNLPATFPAICNTCARTSCCSSMNAFYTSVDVRNYTDCLDLLGCDGTDPTCDLICDRAYPAGSAQARGFVTCMQTTCAAQCP